MPCEFEPQCAFCHQGNFVFPALMILSFNSMEKDKTNWCLVLSIFKKKMLYISGYSQWQLLLFLDKATDHKKITVVEIFSSLRKAKSMFSKHLLHYNKIRRNNKSKMKYHYLFESLMPALLFLTGIMPIFKQVETQRTWHVTQCNM